MKRGCTSANELPWLNETQRRAAAAKDRQAINYWRIRWCHHSVDLLFLLCVLSPPLTIYPASSLLQAFDTEFTKVDQGVLFELILVSRSGRRLLLLSG